MKLYATVFFAFIICFSALGQSQKVHEYLKMVAEGKVTEVKTHLPDLLAAYPEDPGIMLLHGVVIEDAYRAVSIYERIVENFPQSEWADDAYWRIVQFYAIIGDIERAQSELETFRNKYPTSEFVAPANDVVRSSIGINRNKNSMNKTFTVKSPVSESNPAMKEKMQPVLKLKDPEEKKIIANTTGLEEESLYTKVEQVADEPEPKEEEPEADNVRDFSDSNNSGVYGLQVSVFSNKQFAEEEMRKFLQQRMRTEVLEKNVRGETMYAVVIGNYSSKESAEAAKLIVKQQCNCDPIVFEK